ncbi:hypothetical protein CPB85DRAFT_1436568 [Mucidula mucida]|nr:hypothetical protein CPB85DRAFT_1436568 [Mucidula mucida]
MSLPPSTQTSFAFDVPQPALVFSSNTITNIEHSRVPTNALNRIDTPTLSTECTLSHRAASAAVKFDLILPNPPVPHPYGQLVGFVFPPLTMQQMLQLVMHGPMGRYIYPSSSSGCTVWTLTFIRLLDTAGFTAQPNIWQDCLQQMLSLLGKPDESRTGNLHRLKVLGRSNTQTVSDSMAS